MYKRQLHDCVVTVLSESNYAPIADQLVAELVDTLLAYSDNAIKKNYIVSSQDVTQAIKVAYKNPFNVYRHTPEYKLFTKENVHRLGADAILASKDQGMLVNDEVVVYDDKQATIRYLIELA